MPSSEVRAIQLTEENIDHVIASADAIFFNLSYLRFNLEDAAGEGSTLYLIMGGRVEDRNVTFTEMREEDFFRTWKFTTEAKAFEFVEIERV